jgi:hypothetical protein
MKGKIHPIGASRHLLKESYKAGAPSGSVNVLQITKADIPYFKGMYSDTINLQTNFDVLNRLSQ